MLIINLFQSATAPSGPGPPHYLGFTITLRHITLGRTPLDEGSASSRDLYLTTHTTHKRQTSMPPAAFEPTIPTSEQPQTHALDRAATGIGHVNLRWKKYLCNRLFLSTYRFHCHYDSVSFSQLHFIHPPTSMPYNCSS
jgi:hypothetical protein